MTIKLSPSELRPGIIAIEPILTPKGQTLAPAMTKLSHQLINKIMLYHVDSVAVDSNDPIVKQILLAGSKPAFK